MNWNVNNKWTFTTVIENIHKLVETLLFYRENIIIHSTNYYCKCMYEMEAPSMMYLKLWIYFDCNSKIWNSFKFALFLVVSVLNGFSYFNTSLLLFLFSFVLLKCFNNQCPVEIMDGFPTTTINKVLVIFIFKNV